MTYYEIYLQRDLSDLNNDNYSVIIKSNQIPTRRAVTNLLKRKKLLEPGYKIYFISEYSQSNCEFDRREAILLK